MKTLSSGTTWEGFKPGEYTLSPSRVLDLELLEFHEDQHELKQESTTTIRAALDLENVCKPDIQRTELCFDPHVRLAVKVTTDSKKVL